MMRRQFFRRALTADEGDAVLSPEVASVIRGVFLNVALGTALVIGVGGGVAAPAAADAGGPATRQRLYATNDTASITLSWTEPATGTRPAYFQVYEGSTVVARNTTTHATVRNLVFESTHTYTITAVDAYGHESAPSAAI